MRYDHVIRFIAFAFAVGAVLGLGGGLVFGGSSEATGKTDAPAAKKTTASTAPAGQMTAAKARTIGANELGEIPVLMYHKLGQEEARYTRSPERFRQDINKLKEIGFYPINSRDLVDGNIEVPAGKSPVVVTFDDSSPNQFRLQADGSVDPSSAVGIMKAAAKAGDWAERASFYCLLDVQPNNNVLFGQPEHEADKLKKLVAWGYEVGSHTVSHLNLKKASEETARKQLLQSQTELNDLIGNGYQVATITIPFGEYPADDSIIKKGTWDGQEYSYKGAFSISEGTAASPFSQEFDPYHLPRYEMSSGEATLDTMLDYFAKHPDRRYISDGDPAAISVPKTAATDLGLLIEKPGRPVVSY